MSLTQVEEDEAMRRCEIVAVNVAGHEQHVVCDADQLAAERRRLERSGYSIVAVIRQ